VQLRPTGGGGGQTEEQTARLQGAGGHLSAGAWAATPVQAYNRIRLASPRCSVNSCTALPPVQTFSSGKTPAETEADADRLTLPVPAVAKAAFQISSERAHAGQPSLLRVN